MHCRVPRSGGERSDGGGSYIDAGRRQRLTLRNCRETGSSVSLLSWSSISTVLLHGPHQSLYTSITATEIREERQQSARRELKIRPVGKRDRLTLESFLAQLLLQGLPSRGAPPADPDFPGARSTTICESRLEGPGAEKERRRPAWTWRTGCRWPVAAARAGGWRVEGCSLLHRPKWWAPYGSLL